jgi:uncharacterized membrane protein YeiB/alpha-beta hydrolase superfamily lysophospholipase
MKEVSRRIVTLDAMRGLAVLGILGMNAVSFGLPAAGYNNLAAAGSDTALDWMVGIFAEVFLDQKVMGLFSLLFGAGVLMFAERAEAAGRAVLALCLWRYALLSGIGMLHSLLWDGDILLVYAVCAPLVLVLRRLTVNALLISGTAAFLVPVIVAFVVQQTLPVSGEGLGEYWFVAGPPMADRVEIFLITDFFARSLGLMLIGAALYRNGFLTAERSDKEYRKAIAVGLWVGVPLAAYGMGIHAIGSFAPGVALTGTIPNTLATVPMTIAYAALVVLWCRQASSWWLARVSAVGCMALTNYIMQSVLGIGLLRYALADDVLTRSDLVVFILSVWALQFVLSSIWLRHFKQGPLEWLWRCATDRSWRPIRLHAFASATVATAAKLVVVVTMGLTVLLATGCANHRVGDGLQLEHFEFQSGGNTLSGVLARPTAAEHFGVVVFVHGDGPVTADHDGGYRPIWAALARAGYASLSWDKPGVGQSSGNWLSQSMTDRADEVGHAIDAIVHDVRVDKQRVALFGASQAGWVIPLVAAHHSPEFIIAVSPAINWLRQSRFQSERVLDTHKASAEVRFQVQVSRDRGLALLNRGAPYAEHLRWHKRLPPDVRPYFDKMSADRYHFVTLNYMADATAKLSELKGVPTLLMQGGQDVLVDVDETAATYKDILGDCLYLRRYADANHSLLRAELSECESCLWITAITNPVNLFPQRMSTDIEDFVRSRQCANLQRN